MDEIKQSVKGIPYAPPERLLTKSRVYTQAILQKVPHNNEDTIDITLKLGRYNIVGAIETSEPKSELTLKNEELNNLIAYIEKYYKPLELDAKKFVTVGDATTAGVLMQFKSMMKSNEEIAETLLENELFTEDIQAALNAIKKRKALTEFETGLKNDNNEHFWQKWFSANKWILGSEYLNILDEREIDVEHIADFLVQAFDGFVDIVEIKKPSFKFWADAKDHGNYIPSTDLTRAITQCQNYIYEIERESNSVKTMDRLNAKIIKPRCLLVFGKSKDWDAGQRTAYRILNSSYTNITILTYDHLFERAKKLIDGVDIVKTADNQDDDLPF